MRIEFTIKYDPKLVGGAVGEHGSERMPYGCNVDGTHQLVSDMRPIIWRNGDDLQARVSMRSETRTHVQTPFFDRGSYENRIESSKVDARGTLSRSSSVQLMMMATTYNECGARCWTTVGFAMVTLLELAAAEKRGGDMVVTIYQNNLMSTPKHTAHAIVKGRVFIKNIHIEDLVLRSITKHDIGVDPAQTKRIANEMNALINLDMAQYFGKDARFKHATIRPLVPFHCPAAQKRMAIPSAAFAMLKVEEEPCVSYFEGLLDIALMRSAMSRRTALKLFEKADTCSEALAAAHSLMARCLNVATSSYTYLADFYNTGKPNRRLGYTPTEDIIKTIEFLGGDDCEGAAANSLRLYKQFDRLKSQNASRLLIHVRDAMRHYVPTTAFGAVTNAKMTAKHLDANNAMAHTWFMLVPFWDFVHRLSDDIGPRFMEGQFYRARKATLDKYHYNLGEQPLLNVQIPEGTAPFDPKLLPVCSYIKTESKLPSMQRDAAERLELAQSVGDLVESEGKITAEIFSGVGEMDDPSPFYKWPTTLTTPVFADLRMLNFCLLEGIKSTYGDTFANFVTMRAKQNVHIEPVLAYTADECKMMDAVLMDIEKMPHLTRLAKSTLQTQMQEFPALHDLIHMFAEYDCSEATDAMWDKVPYRFYPKSVFVTVRACDIDHSVIDTLAMLCKNYRAWYKVWYVNDSVDNYQNNIMVDVYLFDQ